MPGTSAIIFGAKYLDKNQITSKRVVDVGSYDFNGSLRPLIESWEPMEYIGVDILSGPSVDVICSAEELVDSFGVESFDVVISTEMLEHAFNWKVVVSNLKRICKPGGILLLTTRSLGYPYHGYPNDFWRYEIDDIKSIFNDFEISNLEADYQFPGVFLKAYKPLQFIENDLSNYKLYSIVLNQRVTAITPQDFKNPYFMRLSIKQKIKLLASKVFLKGGASISKLLNI